MTIIGLIPCGGKAERLAGIPKYLLPVGNTYLLAEVVRKLHAVKGCDWVYIGSGLHNQRLVDEYAPDKSRVYRADSRTMCEGVLEAKQYTADYPVIMCMGDTHWQDETVLGKLADELSAGTDIVIGAWFTRPDQRNKLGMLDFSNDYKLRSVDDKPDKTALTHAWGAVAWSPIFYQHIKPTDKHLGLALNRAVEAGLTVKVVVSDGEYHDLGCMDSLIYFYSQFATAGVK